MNKLDGLQTSEFLEPAKVARADLQQPLMKLRLWQSNSSSRARVNRVEGSESEAGEPALSLLIGRHDVLKKTVYGQIEGDNIVLALPDTLLDVLPHNRLAYRDRGVLSVNPGIITRLQVIREGKTIRLSNRIDRPVWRTSGGWSRRSGHSRI